MIEMALYRVSFTAGGLFLRESARIARLYFDSGDWEAVRNTVMEENLLQFRTRASTLRMSRELCDRLMSLKWEELEVVADGEVHERAALLWLAVCRQYRFVREFATEVIHTRFFTYQRELSYDDFDAFFNAKAAWHEELDQLTDATRAKLRQVLFRIMREAGLLTDSGMLQPVSLSPRVARLVAGNSPECLNIFNVADTEIKEMAG